VGIISGIGDRRDEDIRECARIACRMFDHIIIRQEHDLRDRTEEKINELLLEGISQSGCANVTYEIISEEADAIRHAMAASHQGDFIVALSDQYKGVVAVIQEELEKEKKIRKPAAIKRPYQSMRAS